MAEIAKGCSRNALPATGPGLGSHSCGRTGLTGYLCSGLWKIEWKYQVGQQRRRHLINKLDALWLHSQWVVGNATRSFDRFESYLWICVIARNIRFHLHCSIVLSIWVGLMESDIFMLNLVADNEWVHCTRSRMVDYELEGKKAKGRGTNRLWDEEYNIQWDQLIGYRKVETQMIFNLLHCAINS